MDAVCLDVAWISPPSALWRLFFFPDWFAMRQMFTPYVNISNVNQIGVLPLLKTILVLITILSIESILSTETWSDYLDRRPRV